MALLVDVVVGAPKAKGAKAFVGLVPWDMPCKGRSLRPVVEAAISAGAAAAGAVTVRTRAALREGSATSSGIAGSSRKRSAEADADSAGSVFVDPSIRAMRRLPDASTLDVLDACGSAVDMQVRFGSSRSEFGVDTLGARRANAPVMKPYRRGKLSTALATMKSKSKLENAVQHLQ